MKPGGVEPRCGALKPGALEPWGAQTVKNHYKIKYFMPLANKF